jgi:hypothetical protein
MANTLSFFMDKDDEVAFLRALEKHRLEIYPEAIPAGYRPLLAGPSSAESLVQDAYYLALPDEAIAVRVIKRGPFAGCSEIDEVRSPVLHYARSLPDETGELRSGRLWVELEATGDRQRLGGKSDLLRVAFEDARAFFKRRFRRSTPAGFFVGPVAARKANEGLALREAGRKGELVRPY